MNVYLTIILLTLTPGLELRASIPYGAILGVHPALVVVLAVVTNIVLGIFFFALLERIIKLLCLWNWFEQQHKRLLEGPQRKIKKVVDRYGEWGVALFIGVPLPGSGVYTAVLGAYVLGISYRHFAKATVFGVIIAAGAVSLIVYGGSAIFGG